MLGMFFHGSRKSSNIAITFDDGPSEDTEKVLDLLKRYNAKATFFVWGERIKGREKILKRMLKEGHEIGNHTYSHKRLGFKFGKFIEDEIRKCDEVLKKVGIETNLFRFPGFSFNLIGLRVCRNLRKKAIFSDMISNDWKDPWKERIHRDKPADIEAPVRKTLTKTRNGSILNFHDYLEGVGRHEEIVLIMERVLPELTKRFKCVTVSELLFP